MSDATVDLASHLNANTSLTSGTDLYVGFMPATPDAVVSLYLGGGTSAPGQMMGEDLPTFEEAVVEVIARAAANDYPAARALVDTTRNSLLAITNQDVNGTRYLGIEEMVAPAFDGRDVEDRVYLRFVLQVAKYL